MQIIDGKKISSEIKQEMAIEVEKIKQSGGKIPHLAAILVGNDGASETYVANKIKACELVGIKSTLIRCEDTVKQEALLDKIKALNANNDIDGFIVQLPLPEHIDEQKVIESVDPRIHRKIHCIRGRSQTTAGSI